MAVTAEELNIKVTVSVKDGKKQIESITADFKELEKATKKASDGYDDVGKSAEKSAKAQENAIERILNQNAKVIKSIKDVGATAKVKVKNELDLVKTLIASKSKQFQQSKEFQDLLKSQLSLHQQLAIAKKEDIDKSNAAKSAKNNQKSLEKSLAQLDVMKLKENQLEQQILSKNQKIIKSIRDVGATAETKIKNEFELTKKVLQAKMREVGITDQIKKRIKEQIKLEGALANIKIGKVRSNKAMEQAKATAQALDKQRKAENKLRLEQEKRVTQQKTLNDVTQTATFKVIGMNQALELAQKAYRAIKVVTDFTLENFSQFEKGVVGVVKTTNLAGPELEFFKRKITEMSEGMPSSTKELLKISEAAGQLGVRGSKDLLKFADTIARLGASTDVSGQNAALLSTRILGLTRSPTGDIDKFGAAIVDLGNNFRATESEILRTTTVIAQGIGVFGASAQEVLALGTASRDLGIRFELAGSAIARSFIAINKSIISGGKTLKTFSQLTNISADTLQQRFGEDSVGVFREFLKGLSQVDQLKIPAVLEELGLKGVEINRVIPTLAKNIDRVEAAFKRSNKAFKENTALLIESNRAFDTTAARSKILKNAIGNIGKSVGTLLEPQIRALQGTLIEFAIAIKKSIEILAEINLTPIIASFKILATSIATAFVVMNTGVVIGLVSQLVKLSKVMLVTSGRAVLLGTQYAILAGSFLGLGVAIKLVIDNLDQLEFASSTVANKTKSDLNGMVASTLKYFGANEKLVKSFERVGEAQKKAAIKSFKKLGVDKLDVTVIRSLKKQLKSVFEGIGEPIKEAFENAKGSAPDVIKEFAEIEKLMASLNKKGKVNKDISKGQLKLLVSLKKESVGLDFAEQKVGMEDAVKLFDIEVAQQKALAANELESLGNRGLLNGKLGTAIRLQFEKNQAAKEEIKEQQRILLIEEKRAKLFSTAFSSLKMPNIEPAKASLKISTEGLDKTMEGINMASAAFESSAGGLEGASVALEAGGGAMAAGAMGMAAGAAAFALAIPDLVNGLADMVDQITNLPGAIIDAMLNLDRALENFITKFPEAVENLIDRLPMILESIIGALPEVATKFLESLIKGVPRIAWALVEGFVRGTIEAFKNMAGFLLTGSFDEAGKSLEKTIENIARSVTGVGAQLFEVTELAAEARGANLAENMRKAIVSSSEVASRKLKGAHTVLETVGGKIANGWKDVYQNVLQPIGKGLADIWGFVFRNILDPIGGALAQLWGAVWTGILQPIGGGLAKLWAGIFQNILAPIGGALAKLWRGVFENVLAPIGGALSKAWKKVFNFLWEGTQNLMSGIGKAFGKVFIWFRDVFGGFISKAWKGLIDFFDKKLGLNMANAIKGWFAFIDYFKDGKFAAQVGAIWDKLISFFTNDIGGFITKAFDAIFNFFTDLPGMLKKGFSDIGDTITGAFDGIFKFFTDLPSMLMDGFSGIGSFFSDIFKLPDSAWGTGSIEKAIANVIPGFDLPFISFAQGGEVPGTATVPGDSALNDKVLSLLSPGEMVMTRSQVKMLKEAFGETIPGFAKGFGNLGKFLPNKPPAISNLQKGAQNFADKLKIPTPEGGFFKALADGDIQAAAAMLDPSNLQDFLGTFRSEVEGKLAPMFLNMISSGFQNGGLVGGSGVGDIIPARLEPGEFVIRKPVVDQLGPSALNRINQGKMDNGSTVNNFEFGDINITSPNEVNGDFVRNRMFPIIKDELKRRTLDGEFMISQRGIR